MPLSIVGNARTFLDKHVDYSGAVAGAIILGSIVLIINFEHGWEKALLAAGKQGAYTLIAGGYMVRFNERIALAFNRAYVALPAGVLGAGGLAVSLTLILHNLKGTPEPLNSTIPTIVVVLVGFPVLGAKARYKQYLASVQQS